MKLYSFILFLMMSSISYSFAADNPLKAVVLAEEPWGFYDESGGIDGVTVSYFKHLSKFLDEPIEVVLVPRQRLLRGMKKGTYDLTITFQDYLSEEFATPLEPTIMLDKMLVGLKALDIKSKEDIEGLRLAIVRGASTGSWVDQNKAIKKIETANFTEALWLLKKGRVDVVTGTEQVIHASLPKVGMTTGDIGTPYFLSCKHVLLMLSNASPNFSKKVKIKNAARELRHSPEWDALLEDAKTIAPDLIHDFNNHN
ncbi:transporter substrate-binding domain-containing protein [uncultured Kiloniella sp.]|uniref:substrate-binding periplasmic protein n=1 Tax=uncultured Kiloniella sp. TaxID=1133091 RepID=UPI0026200981|nr:transporter substrate-binding domain-containing protein [uncultured Kiloniella sp.]